ncbi:Pxl1p [Trichuris trichiura]|uniref:Pxl1p n=1 Tax=Trichuris trichiura TaxID=36087 RepID=A0A077YVZ5_TRITR|nr:Pxl1p [Trichuris trichiura]
MCHLFNNSFPDSSACEHGSIVRLTSGTLAGSASFASRRTMDDDKSTRLRLSKAIMCDKPSCVYNFDCFVRWTGSVGRSKRNLDKEGRDIVPPFIRRNQNSSLMRHSSGSVQRLPIDEPIRQPWLLPCSLGAGALTSQSSSSSHPAARLIAATSLPPLIVCRRGRRRFTQSTNRLQVSNWTLFVLKIDLPHAALTLLVVGDKLAQRFSADRLLWNCGR